MIPRQDGVQAQQTAKQQPQFAVCSRSQYSRDYQDWITVAGLQSSDFDICPSCFETSINPTSYRDFFEEAAQKQDGVATRCDFSSVWVRLGWTWLLARNLPDVLILATVAAVEVPEGPCPNRTDADASESFDISRSNRTSALHWYTLRHPDTGTLLSNDFTICSWCLANIETIFPRLRGMFELASQEPCEGTCDLVLKPGSKRIYEYLGFLVDAAVDIEDTGSRDTLPMATFIKQHAGVLECAKSNVVKGRCFIMPALPDLTVCEECYRQVVVPQIRSGSQVAVGFSSAPQSPPQGFTCQMYSPRMRQAWEYACTIEDISYLREIVMQRNRHAVEIFMKLEGLKMKLEQEKTQRDYFWNMAIMEQTTAMNASLNASIAGGFLMPDFSSMNAMNDQAMQLRLQAVQTAGEMDMLSAEWKNYWE